MMNFAVDMGVPAGIKMAFYAIVSVPAIIGVALICLGIYIVVKYKNKD